jgi:hypothetical protein
MKRFLVVLIASFFMASAAYAADAKGDGKAKDDVKVEKSEKGKDAKAKGKAKATKAKGKAKDGKAKGDAKPETK